MSFFLGAIFGKGFALKRRGPAPMNFRAGPKGRAFGPWPKALALGRGRGAGALGQSPRARFLGLGPNPGPGPGPSFFGGALAFFLALAPGPFI